MDACQTVRKNQIDWKVFLKGPLSQICCFEEPDQGFGQLHFVPELSQPVLSALCVD